MYEPNNTILIAIDTFIKPLPNLVLSILQYENIMFASPTSDTIKIIDFGLSKKYGQENNNGNDNPQGGGGTMMMKEFVGTLYTMAPEVIRGHYDEKCDIWSIGVLTYMLLSSCVPFYGDTNKDTMRKILRNQWEFQDSPTDPRWKNISNEAKGFIQSIFTQDVEARPSATEAMEDVWFQQQEQQGLNGGTTTTNNNNNNSQPMPMTMSVAVMDRVQATIQTFAGYPRLKKLALLVIAHQSIDEEIGFLRRLFLQRFDTQKANANVSYNEFKDALEGYAYNYNYSEDELWSMFTGMDIDGTGKVSFTEFLAATIEAHGMIEEERIAEAFDRIDCDDSGYITVDNLKEVLGDEVGDDFIDELMDEVKPKQNGENQINYEDFLSLWDSESDEKAKDDSFGSPATTNRKHVSPQCSSF